MFKKLFTILIAFSVNMSSLQASSVIGLKESYDELAYSLQVEWDQRDEKFKKTTVDQFNKKIDELRLKGLTNQEMIEFSLSQVKDERLKAQVQGTLNLMNLKVISDVEAKQIIQENLEKSLAKGASWNGSTVVSYAIIILIIVVVMAIPNATEDKKDLPMGAQPDGSYCGYGQVCSWQEPDCFFYSSKSACDPDSIWYGDDEYVCGQQYSCVR